MRSKHKLLIEQFDRRIEKMSGMKGVSSPDRGWIFTVRTALNMTRQQLGNRMGLSKGAIQKIEEREVTGQLSINKLRDVATALDMQLVYGFIPNEGSLKKMLDKRAMQLAREIVARTDQNMRLEDQGVVQDRIDQSINELAEELSREMKRSLWD